jgi:hypothetical protein
MLSVHIARSGQSWQSLLFCVSGQHGMSADIDISLISSAGSDFAAADEARSPAIAKMANKQPMDRKTRITQHHIGSGTLEARTFHKSANQGVSIKDFISRMVNQRSHRAVSTRAAQKS